MSTLHMPGPWEITAFEDSEQHYISPVAGNGSGWVGDRYMRVGGVVDIHTARLIAAAPELLAALECALAAGIIDINGEPDMARAAIAKAAGVTP